MLLKILQYTDSAPTAQNYLVQHVNRAEVEKSSLRGNVCKMALPFTTCITLGKSLNHSL